METSEGQCRICLKAEVFFDWTEAIFEFYGPSYKECFFRYTHLQEQEEDVTVYTQMLCLDCGNGLRDTYQLVEKALASDKKLKELQSTINSQTVKSIAEEQIVFLDTDDVGEEIIFIDTDDIEEQNTLTDMYEELNANSEEQNIHLDISRKGNMEKKSYSNSTDNPETISDYESDDSVTGITLKDKNEGRKPKKKKKIPLMCVYCSRILYTREHLVAHEKTHDEHRERNEVCKVCGLKFFNRTALRAHQRIHEENRVREKKCEFCPKAFFGTGALNIHRRIHLGQMIKCRLCPKEFFRQVDLNRHMYSHGLTSIDGEKYQQRRPIPRYRTFSIVLILNEKQLISVPLKVFSTTSRTKMNANDNVNTLI